MASPARTFDRRARELRQSPSVVLARVGELAANMQTGKLLP